MQIKMAKPPRRFPVIDLNNPRLRWRIMFFLVAGILEAILLTIGGFKMLEFTESKEFCGLLCHSVMRPEYVAYEISPHARVSCSECHVGPGASFLVKSKIQGIPLILATAFNTYGRPIPTPVANLRPARETCEQCHWPQKLTGNLLRTYQFYLPDETNTRQSLALAFRVGGGEAETAKGIHWHISSKVWYLPLDESRQDIGWVGVENKEGKTTEYFDSAKRTEISPQKIEQEKRLMDCIDCHNRATHIFYSPDELLNQSLSTGKIDSAIPYIKKKGLEVLDLANPSINEAVSKAEALKSFYQDSYPQVYQGKEQSIDQAITELKRLTEYVFFPEMKVNWQTHTNNLKHSGCFRCHGKLVSSPTEGESETIDATCTSCHLFLPSQGLTSEQ